MPKLSMAVGTGLEPAIDFRRQSGFQPGAIPFRSPYDKTYGREPGSQTQSSLRMCRLASGCIIVLPALGKTLVRHLGVEPRKHHFLRMAALPICIVPHKLNTGTREGRRTPKTHRSKRCRFANLRTRAHLFGALDKSRTDRITAFSGQPLCLLRTSAFQFSKIWTTVPDLNRRIMRLQLIALSHFANRSLGAGRETRIPRHRSLNSAALPLCVSPQN